MPYKTLSQQAIERTAESLLERIKERFPDKGITKVSYELTQVAHNSAEQIAWIKSPLWGIRVAAGLIVFAALSLGIWGLTTLDYSEHIGIVDFFQTLEAGINDLLFIGAALYFLISMETRIKRNRSLRALDELRSLAHVIDMHQLTKDPERNLTSWEGTASSPVELMTEFELTRYLDYCAEMLSLVGKVAALYAQNFNDHIVLNTVTEIESLTTGLSRKIWQKIVVIRSTNAENVGLAASSNV